MASSATLFKIKKINMFFFETVSLNSINKNILCVSIKSFLILYSFQDVLTPMFQTIMIM